MVIQPLIGHPYNGYINPYYWVDDHPLLYHTNRTIHASECRTPCCVSGYGQTCEEFCTLHQKANKTHQIANKLDNKKAAKQLMLVTKWQVNQLSEIFDRERKLINSVWPFVCVPPAHNCSVLWEEFQKFATTQPKDYQRHQV